MLIIHLFSLGIDRPYRFTLVLYRMYKMNVGAVILPTFITSNTVHQYSAILVFNKRLRVPKTVLHFQSAGGGDILVFYSLDILRRAGVSNGEVFAAAIQSVGTCLNVAALVATARINRRPQIIAGCAVCGGAMAGFAACVYVGVRRL